jgi:hypothetical protein
MGKVFPSADDARQMAEEVVRAAMLSAGFCVEHGLDFPIHIVQRKKKDGVRGGPYYDEATSSTVMKMRFKYKVPERTMYEFILHEAWSPLKLFGGYVAHYVNHHSSYDGNLTLPGEGWFNGTEEAMEYAMGSPALEKSIFGRISRSSGTITRKDWTSEDGTKYHKGRTVSSFAYMVGTRDQAEMGPWAGWRNFLM